MPQITLEYTANIGQEVQSPELLGGIHERVAGVVGLPIENCKGRVVVRDEYHIGAGEGNKAFVHACVRILSGRAAETRRELGETILAFMKEYFLPSKSTLDIQITVEVQEIERDAYFKDPPGTLGPTEGEAGPTPD
jgi:5-carboxymethyl-2-hydroxymuconate isomerase